ncbi:MAG: AAA family ATPase [Candidatus Hodarchaeota archaeon]
MKRSPKFVFLGNQQRRTNRIHQDSPSTPEPYIASPELIQAVNLSIYVGRPLLLEGEAGCGKTRLARAVAYELGLPFYPWYVRSTSKAQEGLYTYDAILRLHDVQTQHIESIQHTNSSDSRKQRSKGRDPRKPTDYRKLGPLGKAFELRDFPAVVLIDEIDKADIDFPNDLLSVLDDPWEFEILETGEVISASEDCKPIVIITSNKEKGNLPAPFLRRCIYHFITFPDEEQLKSIIDIHYKMRGLKPSAPKLVEAAIQRFIDMRNKGDLHKQPGTSEFLDWVEALENFESVPYKSDSLAKAKTIPYPGLLLKLRSDFQNYTTLR